MIAFAGLVVVPKHARTTNHVGKPVLEAMGTSCQRFGQLPEHQLSKRRSGVDDSRADERHGLHVGDDTNARLCCQWLQHLRDAEQEPSSVTRVIRGIDGPACGIIHVYADPWIGFPFRPVSASKKSTTNRKRGHHKKWASSRGGRGQVPFLLAEQKKGGSLMIFCARATRGLRRPSLDARSGRSISPHP